MRNFLIDFENVKGGGLYGIDRLTKDDHVIVLYTRNANTISIGEHLTLMQCECKIDFIELLHLGKNALDFQLVMLLGVMGGRMEAQKPSFFIISGDTGYDVITEMNVITGLHADIVRCRTIAEALDAELPREEIITAAEVPVINKRESAVRDFLLGTAYENRLSDIILAIRECSTKDEVHCALGARFKNEGTAIYKIIKPALTYQRQQRNNNQGRTGRLSWSSKDEAKLQEEIAETKAAEAAPKTEEPVSQPHKTASSDEVIQNKENRMRGRRLRSENDRLKRRGRRNEEMAAADEETAAEEVVSILQEIPEIPGSTEESELKAGLAAAEKAVELIAETEEAAAVKEKASDEAKAEEEAEAEISGEEKEEAAEAEISGEEKAEEEAAKAEIPGEEKAAVEANGVTAEQKNAPVVVKILAEQLGSSAGEPVFRMKTVEAPMIVQPALEEKWVPRTPAPAVAPAIHEAPKVTMQKVEVATVVQPAEPEEAVKEAEQPAKKKRGRKPKNHREQPDEQTNEVIAQAEEKKPVKEEAAEAEKAAVKEETPTAGKTPAKRPRRKPAAKKKVEKPADAELAAKAPEVKPEDAKEAEAKPEEGKAPEAKPEESKAAEVKPEDAKAAEVKPEDAKAAEAKMEESKTAEIQLIDTPAKKAPKKKPARKPKAKQAEKPATGTEVKGEKSVEAKNAEEAKEAQAKPAAPKKRGRKPKAENAPAVQETESAPTVKETAAKEEELL